MRKYFCLAILLTVVAASSTTAQVRLRANAVGWGMAIANIGAEVALTDKITFVGEGYYSPFWNIKNFRLRGWNITPELRYYFCEKFNKHYIGIHGNYGDYTRLQPSSLSNIRSGAAYGAGVTYGHQWYISRHWAFDLYAGIGWWHMNADVYCKHDPEYMFKSDASDDKFGLSRFGATFAYKF